MKNALKITRALFVLLLVQSCATTNQHPEVAPLPAPTEQCQRNQWCYNDIITSTIMPAMLYSKPGELCPAYDAIDKKKFWAALFKAIAYCESQFEIDATYTETTMGIDPITKKQVVSEGLFSLSYQDSSAWHRLPGCAKIDYQKKNIRDPQIQVECSVQIGDALIQKYGADVTTALSHYWSVIRPGKDKLRQKLKEFIPECYEI